MKKISEYIKTLFLILILLQFAPPILRNIKNQWMESIEPKNKVGYISINQPIFSSSHYTKQLKKYFKDSSIQAILLQIDSPGGAAGSSQALAYDVQQLRKLYPKPVVTYSENICTSGAYCVAAMTDHIVTTGSAMIGNIGSKLSTQFKLKQFLLDYKIESHSISTGKYKNALDPFTELTEDQKTMLQNLSDDCYNQLVSDVAQARRLSLQQKDQWAAGKVFTGQEAKQLKLIDEIGNQETAIVYIKKNILHSDREIQLIKSTQPSQWQQWFKQYDDDDEMQYNLVQNIFITLLSIIKKCITL